MINNLKNINLNHFKVFYVLATSKSFLEASKQLYISQPAVSRDIKILEELLGVKLFFRDCKGVEITKEGMILFKYIEKAFSNMSVGVKLIESEKELDTGKITIGIPSHIASFFLLKRIEKFKQDYPNISIEIISSSTKELIKDLDNHKIDFVIDSSPLDNLSSDMKLEVLESFDTCFISKNNLKISEIKEIENIPLILPISKSSVRKNLEKELKKYGVSITPTVEVETTDLIISSVKRNFGVGYVIKESVKKELENNSVKLVKFPEKLPTIDINLIYIEDCLTYAAKKFINHYIKDIS